jgi:hypothetical protein
MKKQAELIHLTLTLTVLAGLILHPPAARALGTAFTYNGSLSVNGAPATGAYDLSFTLYNAATNGTAFGALTNTATPVTNGLFTVTLDFGEVFNGANYWLQLAARTNNGGGFSPLSPLQPLTPAPYAIYSATAGTAATAVSAASANAVAGPNITGTVPLAQLPAAVLTNHQSGVTLGGGFNGNFTGDGTGLSNVITGPVGISALGNEANGYLALTANANGTNNSANGTQTLQDNGSGYDNTADGYRALMANTTGYKNTADGEFALATNTTGYQNTALGGEALEINTTGANNTACGQAALDHNTTASGNTACGWNALLNNTTGNENIAVGFQAGYNLTTGGNNIDLGNPGVVTDTNIIRIGSGQTQAFIAGVITGNGAGLTNLPAGAVTGGLTINLAVLVPGGTTNILCFTNGILFSIK